MAAPTVQRILNLEAAWTVWNGGAVDLAIEGRREPEFPELPRFGLRLFLPETFSQVEYCGLGPWESYQDKRRASWHGLFSGTAAGLHEDYIRPQENGSHADCDHVTVSEDGKTGLTAAGAVPFSFSASPYTQEELTEKAHNYELQPCGSTVLCLDYAQAGIGSNSCGPRLRSEYRLEEPAFSFRLRLTPWSK